MKSSKVSTIITILFISYFHMAIAQEFSGKAYYSTHKKFNTLLDSSKYDDKTLKKVQGFFTKQFQKKYVLEFNKNTSLYSQAEKLDIKGTSNNSVDKLYKNFKTKKYTNKKEFLGKMFSIQDSITIKSWKITNKTKVIGEFTCIQAILNTKVNDSTIVNVKAWFTYQIPISNGPNLYDGLPGLIMQLEDGNYTYLCNRIEISDKELILREPKGGKTISQSEFNKLVQEKKEEGQRRAKAYFLEREKSKY